MKKEINFKSLRKFNIFMGILHLVQGAAMLIFALTYEKATMFKVPLNANYLDFDVVQRRLVTAPKELFTVPFAVLVAVFLLMSAVAHFIIAAPKTNDIYNRDLEKGINKFRWYEYAVSSSLMIFLIAILFGVYDVGALIAIVAANASMNLFGLLMEEINQNKEKVNWKPFVFGSIAGLAPWIIIILHAFGNADPSQVPWFAYAIFGSYLVFFNLFPINMWLQYKKIGKWKNYIYGERTYIILSLVAKSVLAWIVFAGIMQPM